MFLYLGYAPAVTATPATSPSAASVFLEKYITDPTLRQSIQAALTQGPGFSAAVQEYGGFLTPQQYKKEARGLRTRQEGETAVQAAQRRQQANRDYMAQRDLNYQQYKQPYSQAEAAFRDLRTKGFSSAEEEASARTGLQEIRDVLFGQYQSGRAVLQAQQKMRDVANRIASPFRQKLIEHAGRDPFKSNRTLQAYNQAIQQAVAAGSLPNRPLMTGGEALIQNMGDLASEARSNEWYEKNRGVSTYNPETKITTPYRGPGIGSEVGVPGYIGGSSNLPAAQPQSQQPTAGTSTGGMIGGVASTLGSAVRSGDLGLNLGVGGSANVLNRADIRSAMEGGMSRRDIRQAVKEGDIRMSGKAKAQLFKNR